MNQFEIDNLAKQIRKDAGLPVFDPTARVRGFDLPNYGRVIGALIKRLGGSVYISDSELENVQGIEIGLSSDGPNWSIRIEAE